MGKKTEQSAIESLKTEINSYVERELKGKKQKEKCSVIESFILSFYLRFSFPFSTRPLLSPPFSRPFLLSFHPAPSITVFIHACHYSSFHSQRRQDYIVFAFHLPFFSILCHFKSLFFLVVFSIPSFPGLFRIFSQVPVNEFQELCNDIYFNGCISKNTNVIKVNDNRKRKDRIEHVRKLGRPSFHKKKNNTGE